MTKEAALLQFNSVPDAGEQLKALGHDDHPNVGNLRQPRCLEVDSRPAMLASSMRWVGLIDIA